MIALLEVKTALYLWSSKKCLHGTYPEDLEIEGCGERGFELGSVLNIRSILSPSFIPPMVQSEVLTICWPNHISTAWLLQNTEQRP